MGIYHEVVGGQLPSPPYPLRTEPVLGARTGQGLACNAIGKESRTLKAHLVLEEMVETATRLGHGDKR